MNANHTAADILATLNTLRAEHQMEPRKGHPSKADMLKELAELQLTEVAHARHAPVSYTADELAAMDSSGAADHCPHCGVHVSNGVMRPDGETTGLHHEFTCMACNGGWGAPIAGFAVTFEGYKAAGNSMCRSLRLTAAGWAEGRMKFIAAAVECGVKPATASANWAAMVRGEV